MLSGLNVKDPYEVLGVGRHATPEEIKSAFRKNGAKHHPDKNPGDDGAAQRFKEINAAYQILSDSKKRAMFDRFGATGIGQAGPAGNPFGGMPIDFSELQFDGVLGDLFDVLGIRVGDRGHVQAEVQVDFLEAAFGCTKTVRYDRRGACSDCGGDGAEPGTKIRTCETCNGRGRVRMQQGVIPIAIERKCSRCNGRGQRPTQSCKACHGAGVRSVTSKVEVTLPAGVETGTTHRVDGKGSTVPGKRTGDLELVVTVKPHELFRRSGDNVLCTIPITFVQAALGDEVEIPTLQGRGRLRIPAGTQPGTVLRVRGKGIPRRIGGRGDQLIEVQVEVPTDLPERVRALLLQLAVELNESVQPQQRTFMEKLRDLFQ
jgi:molecular chaperone DnaJ